jgi:hypothetical protein
VRFISDVEPATRNALPEIGRLDIGGYDERALLRQHPRLGGAVAARSTGDYHHFAVNAADSSPPFGRGQ